MSDMTIVHDNSDLGTVRVYATQHHITNSTNSVMKCCFQDPTGRGSRRGRGPRGAREPDDLLLVGHWLGWVWRYPGATQVEWRKRPGRIKTERLTLWRCVWGVLVMMWGWWDGGRWGGGDEWRGGVWMCQFLNVWGWREGERWTSEAQFAVSWILS